MEYRVYSEKAQEGANLVEAGALEQGAAVFHELVESDISDIDKCLMCCNVALVCEKMGLPEDALRWYDAAAAFEQPYSRCFALERKAGFLSQTGRDAEAIAIYEHLMPQPYQTEHDKERIWNNLTLLKNRRK